MGRLFLKGPRNARENLAGENCHGPGRAHVEAGGGKGKGDLPTSGTAAQRATATAQSFPAFANQLIQVTTRLRYNFWKGWTARMALMFEQFRQKNWQTDDLNPFIPGVTSISREQVGGLHGEHRRGHARLSLLRRRGCARTSIRGARCCSS